MDPAMRIIISKVVSATVAEFVVCVIDDNGHVLHRYTYHTVESARRAAAAWTAAYDNCPIEDTTRGPDKG
jgi:hypothetical protein